MKKLPVLKYAVGIDVSKDELEVSFCKLEETLSINFQAYGKFLNSNSGFKGLVKWIKKHHKKQGIPLIIVLEATGVYHENVSHFLFQSDFDLSIVLPNQSNNYLKSLGNKSKTDKIDSKGLAQMGAERQLRLWEAPNEFLMELRDLTRHKNTLEKIKTDAKNRLHAQVHSKNPSKLIIKQLRQQVKSLTRQVVSVEQAIETLLEQDNEVNEKITGIVDSIKGVGKATVAAIVAETNGFELFYSQGQLISYAGYDVVENQSGKRSGKTKISKKGNSHIRKTMFFPAFNVVRYEVGTFAQLYERVYDRTKIKMKGYVAVQRKLLCMIYTLWKKNEVFDPEYHLEKKEEKIDEIRQIDVEAPLFA